MKKNIISIIKKINKFTSIIIFSLIINSCSSTKASELENLLNKYGGDENEVVLNKENLILIKENPFLKTVSTINISEVKNISYHFVEGNQLLAHQLVINCSTNKSVEIKSKIIPTDIKRETIFQKFNNLSFTNKKASLEAKKILEKIFELK